MPEKNTEKKGEEKIFQGREVWYLEKRTQKPK